MKSHSFWLTSLIIAGFGITGLVAANAAQKLSAQPTSTAVVDVQTVILSVKENMQIKADLKSSEEKLSQELEKRQSEYQNLTRELDILLPDSAAHTKKQSEIEKETIDIQSWITYQRQKQIQETAMQNDRLYRKIIDTIGQIASQEGIDIVLYKEKPVDFRILLRNVPLDQLVKVTIEQFLSRKVLWTTEELDITNQVIQVMNNEFTNITQ